MNKDKQIEELKSEIIGHKQIIEQLECDIIKKDRFVEENYPTINDFKVSKGWHGGGTSTYRVEIDVFAEDLHKLVRYFTHRCLRDKKYKMINQEIKKQIKEEIEKEELTQ